MNLVRVAVGFLSAMATSLPKFATGREREMVEVEVEVYLALSILRVRNYQRACGIVVILLKSESESLTVNDIN
jgi:hypothetical protein